MVWVSNIKYNPSCHHGGTVINSKRIINIFNGRRDCTPYTGGCGYGFSFGSFGKSFLGALGMGLGFNLASRLFGGISSWINGGSFLGGMGFGNNYGMGGYYPGAGQAGMGLYGIGGGLYGMNNGSNRGCNCGCSGSGNGTGAGTGVGSFTYTPGEYSTIGNNGGKVKGTGNEGDPKPKTEDPKPKTEGDPNGKQDGVGTIDKDNEKHYNIKEITGNVPEDAAKEARANFWKSIGANTNLTGLDIAGLPKGFELKTAENNPNDIYLIYDNNIAFRYDTDKKMFYLPDEKTDFKTYIEKNKDTYSDDPSNVKNIGQPVNEKMTITPKEENGVTTVETTQKDGVKEYEEAVKECYTLAHALTNHNENTKVSIISTENVAEQYDLDGNKKITFDEFIAVMNGYNADVQHALEDASYKKGRKEPLLKTVDIDGMDTIQLVNIFNKYAKNSTHITYEKFQELIDDIEGKSAVSLTEEKEA